MITVEIHINKLIDKVVINTASTKMSKEKLKEQISKILIDATNSANQCVDISDETGANKK